MSGGLEGLNREQEVSRKGTPFDSTYKIQLIPNISESYQLPKNTSTEIVINQTGTNKDGKQEIGKKKEEKQEDRQEKKAEKQEEKTEKKLNNFIDKIKKRQQDGLGERGIYELVKGLNQDQYGALLESKEFHDYIRNESHKEKSTILKIVLHSGFLNGDDAGFGKRNRFVNQIFTSFGERKAFIKESIISVKNSDEEVKKQKRKEISNYFLVGDLIDTFEPEYQRDYKNNEKNKQVRSMFFKRAGGKGEYENNVAHNEKIRDRFLDVMMNISIVEKAFDNVLDTTREGYVQSFFIEKKVSDGEIKSLEIAIQSIDGSLRKRINELNKNQIFILMDRLVSGKRKTEGELKSGFALEEKPANTMSAVLKMSDLDKEIDEISKQKGISTEVSKEEVANKALSAALINLKLDPTEQGIAESNMRIVTNEYGKETYVTVIGGQEFEILNTSNVYQVSSLEYAIKRERLEDLGDDTINKRLDEIDKEYFAAYVSLNKQEDLRQVRGEEKYAEVEQQYLSTIKNETKNELETYQKTEAGKEIQNLFSPDGLYFKQIFSGQKLIKEEDIRGNLGEQEYAKALERIYSDKQENKLDDSLQNHGEHLSTNVDDTTKNAFMQNVSYFLQNVLDIQLDKEGQENILKNLSINQENFATSKSQEIQISGIDKNNPIKKYDFTYNIVTGEFKTNKLMDIQQGDKYASLNQITPLTEIRGPKFGEFFDNAKVISHQVLRDEKVNSEQNFLKEFDTRLTLSTKIPKQSDKAKEQMKLFCLQNVLTQEILDMMKIQNDQIKNDEELFPLLARSINLYSSEELITTRSIIKSMRDFYEIQEQIKNISNLSELEREAAIDSNIADLSKKVDGEEVYKEISSKTFYLIRAIETDPKDTIKNFSLFFKSFLDDKKDNGNDIISPKKLISYKQDLEKPNAINDSSYLAQFEQNMSTFEDQALDQKISHQNLA